LVEPDHPAPPATPKPDAQDAGRDLADLDLAAACQRGDLAAYEHLYRVHGARLKSVAFNLLGSSTDAEDAVQETFLRVYRSAKGFKGQSAFATWIYRILVNCCYDLRRRKAHLQQPEADAAEGEEPAAREAAAPAADHPLRLALEACVARLSPKHREVFVLFEVQGFRHSEIAAMLDISEALSKNRLYEAKQQLRRLLQAEKDL